MLNHNTRILSRVPKLTRTIHPLAAMHRITKRFTGEVPKMLHVTNFDMTGNLCTGAKDRVWASFNGESGTRYIRRATSLNESVCRKQYAPLPLSYVCLSLSWNPECLTSSPRISMGQFSMNPIGGRQSQTRQTMRCQTAVRIPSAAISDTYTRLNYFFERESAISVSSWWILFESIQLYKFYVEQLFLTALRNTFRNRV